MKKFHAFLAMTALAGTVCSGSASAVTLIHDYQLNGNLNDVYAGPSLVSLGGSLVSTPGSYDFGANQGLSLTGGLTNPAGDWSLDFRASYSSLSNTWKKLVDYSNLASDNGLYFTDYGQGNKLEFWPYAGIGALGADTVVINTSYTIAFSHSITGMITGFVNGVQQWSVSDAGNNYGLPGANILTFFTDDYATSQGEAQPGSVDFIRIYDGLLTQGEVAVLNDGGTVGGGTVPEPASLLLTSLGLLGLGMARRKRS